MFGYYFKTTVIFTKQAIKQLADLNEHEVDLSPQNRSMTSN